MKKSDIWNGLWGFWVKLWGKGYSELESGSNTFKLIRGTWRGHRYNIHHIEEKMVHFLLWNISLHQLAQLGVLKHLALARRHTLHLGATVQSPDLTYGLLVGDIIELVLQWGNCRWVRQCHTPPYPYTQPRSPALTADVHCFRAAWWL